MGNFNAGYSKEFTGSNSTHIRFFGQPLQLQNVLYYRKLGLETVFLIGETKILGRNHRLSE